MRRRLSAALLLLAPLLACNVDSVVIRTRSQVGVDEVQVTIADRRVEIDVRGHQSACGVELPVSVQRHGNVIEIAIEKEQPADQVCIAVAVEYRAHLVLDGTFDPGAYVLRVNGFFTAFVVP